MIKGIAAILALALSGAPLQAEKRQDRQGYADPSALIASEIAFARLAREKGQWTAFRKTATADAEMFVPQRVLAQAWLKKRPDPPVALQWQPYQAWVACDGSYGVTRGAWQRDGATGYFTTVWQRQAKTGDYLWVLDQGDDLAAALPAPEMLTGRVAACTPPPGTPPAGQSAPGWDSKDGASRDGTLRWTSQVAPDGGRQFVVWLWNGTAFEEIIRSLVKSPATP